MFALEGSAPCWGAPPTSAPTASASTWRSRSRSGRARQLRFDLLVDGKVVPIHSKARTQYCILSNGEFKVGLQFLNLELAAMTALSRFLVMAARCK